MASPETRPTASDTPPADPQSPDALPYRRLYRSPNGRIVGGVAQGLAVHLGLPVTWVRIAFILLFFTQGIGVLLYAAFWVVVPLGIGEPAPGAAERWVWTEAGFVRAGVARPAELRKERPDGMGRLRELLQRTFHGESAAPVAAGQEGAAGGSDAAQAGRTGGGLGQLFGLLGLVIGIMALLSVLGIQTAKPYVWPLLAVGVGVALVWRQADDSRWQRWFGLEEDGPRRSRALARVGAGVLLVLAGIIGFFILQGVASPLALVVESTVAVLAGCLVLVGPYALRLWQDLGAERTARIRAQERAEIAAHVHDSVLHTLTLIQRRAEDPKEVLRLARAQERELRLWLYRPDAAAESAPDTMAERLREVVAEVEDRHGVPVELVCVGDCPMDERIAAQMQAAREAMVNAAKYGGGGPVQVYAEVEGRTVSVFVRDRGPGFDPDDLPEDRMGVRESIIGRMKRNGGTAKVRPAPDGGTEVELEMERADD
ncbi:MULTISPECIES: PspC domain-containing protein [Kitasatospora]|uniref:Signal transduction histidine kinase/phage shock protein PspC (Stress-responsive transcriptional regulator) n=2 Tax=Kitasatospora TaxID=2063 RepID=A0ABT1IXI9_9ACTN|nr:ATP-binding protein [Kitasatospora paracochleata]MCP2309878.1 signal transduction histidine kinase/phage shock protein PspC (stress-responsive transcriptional regulator) [Kitasatospora paracochleata]